MPAAPAARTIPIPVIATQPWYITCASIMRFNNAETLGVEGETGGVVCSTSGITSVNARFGSAVRARGRVEQVGGGRHDGEWTGIRPTVVS